MNEDEEEAPTEDDLELRRRLNQLLDDLKWFTDKGVNLTITTTGGRLNLKFTARGGSPRKRKAKRK